MSIGSLVVVNKQIYRITTVNPILFGTQTYNAQRFNKSTHKFCHSSTVIGHSRIHRLANTVETATINMWIK